LTKYFKKQQDIEIRVICKKQLNQKTKLNLKIPCKNIKLIIASTTLVLLKSISRPLMCSHQKITT